MPALSISVTAPVAVPLLVGWKTALIVQLAPGATVEAHVPSPPKANGPLMANVPLNVNVDALLLVRVEYSTELALPTLVEEKLIEPGVRVTASAPVPLNGSVWVPASSVTVTTPVAAPAAVGLKAALMVQLAPGARVAPQVPSPPKANGPLMTKAPVKVSVELPVLVTAEYSTALVAPTTVEGKLIAAGDRLIVLPDSPVPLRLTCVALPLVGVMLSVAVSVPVVCGVNVTLMEHVAPAATEEPQLLV